MKKKILIVDDEDDIRQVLKLNLELNGYLTQTAKDGRSALAMLAYEKSDLILLDVMMPQMTGWEVAEALNKDLRTRYIPVIMLTALSQTTDKLKGFELGVDDYLPKPFEPAELLARIEAVLRRSDQETLIDKVAELPVKSIVRQEIEKKIDAQGLFAAIFIKLNQFKQYQQSHDRKALELRKKLGDIIYQTVLPSEFAGVWSEDQFVVVTTPLRANPLCLQMIKQFEQAKRQFHALEEMQQGYMICGSNGDSTRQPLISLGEAIITNEREPIKDLAEIETKVDAIWKQTRAISGSTFLDYKTIAR
jgi:DNA-binding response OmpR family regulator